MTGYKLTHSYFAPVFCAAAFGIAAFLGASVANATAITIVGQTASIGNGFTDNIHPVGSHFHTSNLGAGELPPGNPAVIDVPGVAEVGGFFGDEDVRGVSEFDLSGSPEGTSAVVLFDVFDLETAGLGIEPIGGLFGQSPLDGTIDVYAFFGDGIESVDDYAGDLIADTPLVSLDVSQLSAGETISLPVTDIYNSLVQELQANPDSAPSALGIRLQNSAGLPSSLDDGAVVFNNFRLEVVPEPSTSVLLLLGMLPWMHCLRRR